MGLGGRFLCLDETFSRHQASENGDPLEASNGKLKLYFSGGLVHWHSCFLEAIRVFKVIIEPILLVVAECWDFDFRFRSKYRFTNRPGLAL